MRQHWRCNTCGAEYWDQDASGVPYFHACGPKTIRTYQLTDGTLAELEQPPAENQPSVSQRWEEYPDKRDENISPDMPHRMLGPDGVERPLTYPLPDGHRELPVKIKAEGRGRTVLG